MRQQVRFLNDFEPVMTGYFQNGNVGIADHAIQSGEVNPTANQVEDRKYQVFGKVCEYVVARGIRSFREVDQHFGSESSMQGRERRVLLGAVAFGDLIDIQVHSKTTTKDGVVEARNLGKRQLTAQLQAYSLFTGSGFSILDGLARRDPQDITFLCHFGTIGEDPQALDAPRVIREEVDEVTGLSYAHLLGISMRINVPEKHPTHQEDGRSIWRRDRTEEKIPISRRVPMWSGEDQIGLQPKAGRDGFEDWVNASLIMQVLQLPEIR